MRGLGLTLSVFVGALVAVTGAVTVAGCSGGGSHGFVATSASTATTPAATTTSSTSGTTAPAARTTPPPPPAPPIPTYGTRQCWPIVFVHGIAGFRSIGPINYWMDAPDDLRKAGFEVLVVQDKPFATIAERAIEAKLQIEAAYPDPRVKINIIAHSMGGLDSRYMISQLGMGDRIATLMTMATPHHGTEIADVLVGIVPGPIQDAINSVFQAVGWDLKSAVTQLTTTYIDNVFNPANPDDARVHYFSFSGVADPTGSAGHSKLFPLLWPTWSILQNLEGDNDGLCPARSAHWGQWSGAVQADHLSEVGQPLGITPSNFDYATFYTKWADELEQGGFGPP